MTGDSLDPPTWLTKQVDGRQGIFVQFTIQERRVCFTKINLADPVY